MKYEFDIIWKYSVEKIRMYTLKTVKQWSNWKLNNEETTGQTQNTILDISATNHLIIFQSYDEISANVRSMNVKQRQVFDFFSPG